MSVQKFLKQVERRKVAVVQASTLPADLLQFLIEASVLPNPWDIGYFDKGAELLEQLEKAPALQRLIAVLPSDQDIPLQKLSAEVRNRRIDTAVLVVVGKAYRSTEDKNRYLYLRWR